MAGGVSLLQMPGTLTIRWARAARVAGIAVAATCVLALLAGAARPPAPEPLPGDVGLGPVATAAPATTLDGAGGSWEFRWPQPSRAAPRPTPLRLGPPREPKRRSSAPAPAAALQPAGPVPAPPPAGTPPEPAPTAHAAAPTLPASPESTPSEFGFER